MAAPWPHHAVTPVTAGDIGGDGNHEIGYILDEPPDHVEYLNDLPFHPENKQHAIKLDEAMDRSREWRNRRGHPPTMGGVVALYEVRHLLLRSSCPHSPSLRTTTRRSR